jgi:hypothetical protein
VLHKILSITYDDKYSEAMLTFSLFLLKVYLWGGNTQTGSPRERRFAGVILVVTRFSGQG